jgi:hypothetical protein
VLLLLRIGWLDVFLRLAHGLYEFLEGDREAPVHDGQNAMRAHFTLGVARSTMEYLVVACGLSRALIAPRGGLLWQSFTLQAQHRLKINHSVRFEDFVKGFDGRFQRACQHC